MKDEKRKKLSSPEDFFGKVTKPINVEEESEKEEKNEEEK